MLSACASLYTVPKSPCIGSFSGRYEPMGSPGGVVKLTITEETDKSLKAKFIFTYNDIEINTKAESLSIDGNKITLVTDWEVQGTSGQTKLIGTLDGDQFKGSYYNAPEDSVAGSWSATRIAANP